MSSYSLPQKLKNLVEDFQLIQDKNERMEMLLFYADQFEEVPEHIAKRPFAEEHRVPACESEAYVWSEKNNGSIDFYFAVENPQGISAKAMAAILDETVSGQPAEEIVKLDEDVVYKLFGRGLSMGKSAGLTSMVAVVRSHAKQYLDEG